MEITIRATTRNEGLDKGFCQVRVVVGVNHREYGNDVYIRLDELESHYDRLMINMIRNLKNYILAASRDDGVIERYPLVPVFDLAARG